jgi:hypothetical protein
MSNSTGRVLLACHHVSVRRTRFQLQCGTCSKTHGQACEDTRHGSERQRTPRAMRTTQTRKTPAHVANSEARRRIGRHGAEESDGSAHHSAVPQAAENRKPHGAAAGVSQAAVRGRKSMPRRAVYCVLCVLVSGFILYTIIHVHHTSYSPTLQSSILISDKVSVSWACGT